MTGSALFFSSYGCLLIINTDLASYCSPPFSLPLSQVDIKSIPCLFAHLGPQTKLPIITTTTRRRRHLIMIATLWTLLMSFEMRKERERERERKQQRFVTNCFYPHLDDSPSFFPHLASPPRVDFLSSSSS